MPETMLGGYELVRRVGTGGMAEVFEARRPGVEGMKQRVALKCILQDLVIDERFVQQFINEARLGSQLRHPNIVAVEDFSHRDGLLYMAMEYVDGVDLFSIIGHFNAAKRPFPPVLATYIMAQVLAGLEFAHSSRDEHGQPCNIIHRDIKPANLMVTRDGTVKIADFGIAKSSMNPYQTQAGGMVKGSMAYMSPEQLAGRPLSPASDLFAAAAVLYEMLTLKRLFFAPQPLELMNKIAGAEVAEELAALEAEHPAFHPILLRALAANPADRFRSAAEFAEALAPLMEGDSARAECVQVVHEVLDARAARVTGPDRGIALFNSGVRSGFSSSDGLGIKWFQAGETSHSSATRLLDREVMSLTRQSGGTASRSGESPESGPRISRPILAGAMVILLILAGYGVSVLAGGG